MKFLSDKKNILLYILASITIAIDISIFVYYEYQIKNIENYEQRSQDVIRTSNAILLDVVQIDAGVKNYLLTSNETSLESFHNAGTRLTNNLEALKNQKNQSAIQLSLVKTLTETAKDRNALLNEMIQHKRSNRLTEGGLLDFLGRDKLLTDKMSEMISSFNNEENELLILSNKSKEKRTGNAELLFFIIFILLVLLLSLVIYFFKKKEDKLRFDELLRKSIDFDSKYSLSLIEASLDPLFTINLAGKITDVNNASIKVTRSTREQLIGSDFSSYFTDVNKAREAYEQVFEKGFVTGYPLTIMDHKLTEVLFNGSVYKDEQGKVMGAVVVSRDITEQNRIEKELTEAKVFAELATIIAEEAQLKAENATHIAEVSVKSKQQFLSNMSHEIRTPMNAIIGFTKVILKTELSTKQKEYLLAIKISGDALIVLINDILDLAKVDAGKMVFEKIPFRLSSSISSMLHLFETKIQEKNLELVKNYDSSIPTVLLGDPLRLHQIILNLVNNAIKFTNQGKIVVSVENIEENEEKVLIKFSVMDTGIGIPEDKLDNIFENFQQATSGTSRLYGGTGLGLAIVKQLVESQGGSIHVESTFDSGSTFSFILGFQKSNEVTEILSETIDLYQEAQNIKILVVEDMHLNQLLMKTLLDDFGFESDIAENGKLAIERLKAKSYDVILMDLQMPEMNGFEATDYIRNVLKSNVPIIALTADVTTTDLAKCTSFGMNDYIAKPVDERILYKKIINHIKIPTMSNQIETVKDAMLSNAIDRCINLNYLNVRTKSNPKLMMEMITLYIEQTPPLVFEMKRSLLDKDWPMLNAAVHKMIPSFVIVGINPDFEVKAKRVQEYAASNQINVEIEDLVLSLEKICLRACIELEEELLLIKKQIA